MADTRCANPEYQLDVDTMMIEYTVYHAVKTKLESAKANATYQVTDREPKQATADRLIQNFDTLLQLFRHHHPTATISEGTTFNIKILEFLVLFDRLSHSDPCDESTIEEREFRSNYSRMWLRAWKPRIDNNRERYISDHIDSHSGSVSEPASYTLSDTLFRFLDLSTDISNALDNLGAASETWYKLAAEYMLHCALERAEILITPETSVLSVKQISTHCSEPFAWGASTPDVKVLHEAGEGQRHYELYRAHSLICGMFREEVEASPMHEQYSKPQGDGDRDTEMTDWTHTTSVENPVWTHLRNKNLCTIIEMVQSMGSDSVTNSEVIGKMHRRFPFQKFLVHLFEFIDGLWCMNMDDGISGKPVLVQIEEGGIRGMSNHEFRGLLDRVGLKMSPTRDGRTKIGTVKWAR